MFNLINLISYLMCHYTINITWVLKCIQKGINYGLKPIQIQKKTFELLMHNYRHMDHCMEQYLIKY